MMNFYHNPRCSKSREALALLQAAGLSPNVIDYQKTPPDIATLEKLQQALNVAPRDMMRTKDDDYRRLHLDDLSLENKHLLQAIHTYPHLLERPIAWLGDKAVIGRPPERVLSLLP